MQADELTFHDADGVTVFCRRWLPDGEARAVVVIAHGLSEHSARYDRFARALTTARYAVYAPDHRGHGRTAGSTGVGRTGAGGHDAIVADLHDVLAVAAADLGPLPAVLFGHSMGALLAQAFAERYGHELSALVLCGSGGVNEGLPDVVAGLRAAVDAGMADEPLAMLGTSESPSQARASATTVGKAAVVAALNAGFEPARTPFDWLSRDPAEVDAYIADPMCGDDAPPTYAFIAGIMQLTLDVMTPEAIAGIPAALPVLLVTGERDAASSDGAQVRGLEARLRAAGLHVDAKYYAGARHELLNELNRDEVTSDIVDWIGEQVGAAAPEPGGP